MGVGEAAFYGPKLDIQIKNVHGKEDTLITIQIDQMLAEKFGMEYTDKDGAKKNPYIIHRTSIGCYERTLAPVSYTHPCALLQNLLVGRLHMRVRAEQGRNATVQIKAERSLFRRGFRVKIHNRCV